MKLKAPGPAIDLYSIAQLDSATRKALFIALRENRKLKSTIRKALAEASPIDLSQVEIETAIILKSVLDILENSDSNKGQHQ